MATNYSEVNEVFLQKITDFYLANLLSSTPTIAENRMLGWMKSSIAMFDRCKANLYDRNDVTKNFNIDLTDKEIEILSFFMCYHWALPVIQNLLHLKHQLGDTAFKLSGTQANHLKALQEFRKICLDDAQYWMMQYTYDTSNPDEVRPNPIRDLS